MLIYVRFKCYICTFINMADTIYELTEIDRCDMFEQKRRKKKHYPETTKRFAERFFRFFLYKKRKKN